MLGQHQRDAAQYRRHMANASLHIESALEEIDAARTYYPVESVVKDYLRWALGITQRHSSRTKR